MFALKGEAAGLFIAATKFDAKKQNKANKQTNKQKTLRHWPQVPLLYRNGRGPAQEC